MKIVIPDHIDMSSEARDKISKLGGTLYEDVPSDESAIIERIKDAEIITANYIDITPGIIDQAPKLRYIIAPAVGYEWIDSAYAASKGIQTINCPTFNSTAVAEHAIALMFSVTRHIVDAANSLRDGKWDHAPYKGVEIHGKKLGLLGYGRIGKQIEAMAKGLGMDVSFINSSSSSTDMNTLLSSSDVVCMCLPLNDSTRGLLDKRRLELLPAHSVLINVGRGATIDQAALADTLRNKKIAGAGLDVFINEPLTGTPVDEIVALAKLPNVVATPHMAYDTEETSKRLGEELLQNIEACTAGRAINKVA